MQFSSLEEIPSQLTKWLFSQEPQVNSVSSASLHTVVVIVDNPRACGSQETLRSPSICLSVSEEELWTSKLNDPVFPSVSLQCSKVLTASLSGSVTGTSSRSLSFSTFGLQFKATLSFGCFAIVLSPESFNSRSVSVPCGSEVVSQSDPGSNFGANGALFREHSFVILSSTAPSSRSLFSPPQFALITASSHKGIACVFVLFCSRSFLIVTSGLT